MFQESYGGFLKVSCDYGGCGTSCDGGCKDCESCRIVKFLTLCYCVRGCGGFCLGYRF